MILVISYIIGFIILVILVSNAEYHEDYSDIDYLTIDRVSNFVKYDEINEESIGLN